MTRIERQNLMTTLNGIMLVAGMKPHHRAYRIKKAKGMTTLKELKKFIVEIENEIRQRDAKVLNKGPIVAQVASQTYDSTSSQDIMLRTLYDEDINTLVAKDREYGQSWKKRGGVGAYVTGVARKFDRVEVQCKKHGWDIFKAIRDNTERGLTTEHILETLADARRYLALIEVEARRMKIVPK